MQEIANKKISSDHRNLPSDSFLLHPYVNKDSVFYGKKDLEENAFVELAKDQISEDKFLFDIEADDCSNFILINNA